MGIFSKSKRTEIITSPCAGYAIPLSLVNDPVFAQGMLGRGVALRPYHGRVTAPIDGRVDTLPLSAHAVTLISEGGTEILIHIGIGTNKLQGRHFKACVKAGERVRRGDVLIEFDLCALKVEGYDTVIPVVICNSDVYPHLKVSEGMNVEENDILIDTGRKVKIRA